MHAGPIGNRGNRILGATYFGLTFARTGDGPVLAYHVSWHKPATPLLDALHDLHADPERAAWLGAHVNLHIWDRGGAGAPTLAWALSHQVPFLTVTSGTFAWSEFTHPRTQTSLGVPIFVRPDATLFDWPCFEGAAVPREIIFPAHPDKGRASLKAIRYKTAAALEEHDLATLDQLYKTRWPNNENAIKDLLAVGFDRNLDRTLVRSTSRGTDGKLLRLDTQCTQTAEELHALESVVTPDRRTQAKVATRRKRLARLADQRASLAILPDKMARAPSGAELLAKLLTMILYNALRLMLARSPLAAVRSMSITKVRALLLTRSVLTVVHEHDLRLYVAPIRDVRERALQQHLLDVINDAHLVLDDRRLIFALQPCTPPRKSGRRRIKPK